MTTQGVVRFYRFNIDNIRLRIVAVIKTKHVTLYIYSKRKMIRKEVVLLLIIYIQYMKLIKCDEG